MAAIAPARAADAEPATGFWERPTLLGDPGGLRSRLEAAGVTVSLSETAEVLGNVSGGTRRAVVFEGLLQAGLTVDTGKAFGWAGGTLTASAYQIHGRGLSVTALGNNLNTVSSLEAERGLLLNELWYEQTLGDGALAVRIGQQAADQEFMISKAATLFVNHTFGWSSFPSVNLPSGGPAYPLSALGVRVAVRPSPQWTLLAGVYDGDPSGRGAGTPQSRNRSGTRFGLRDGVFAIAEVQYAPGAAANAGAERPTLFKLGGYYHDGGFDDLGRNAYGESLADPGALSSDPRRRRSNWALYGVADQRVWTGAAGSVTVFARLMGAAGDRNLVNAYADGGVTWKGAVPGRPDDQAGLAFAIARISDTAAALDAELARATPGARIRRQESLLELTYQAQLAPWWQVQPFAQYVFRINGGVADPRRPGRALGDAAVLGLRTAVTF